MTGYSERRVASLQETLTAIDDAVQRRCSQCHDPLPEDSPSEWFCPPTGDADCQWSWHQAQAANPGEVYVGVDAGYQIDMERVRALSDRVGDTPTWVASPDARISVMGDSGWRDITDCVSGVSISPAIHDEHAVTQAIGEFVGVPVSESSDLPEGIALRYTTERGIEVPAAQGHHHTHCQHEAECCRCEGHAGCRRIPVLTIVDGSPEWIPDEDWRRATYNAADTGWLRRAIRRLTNSGGT